jgi:hypothetical protein
MKKVSIAIASFVVLLGALLAVPAFSSSSRPTAPTKVSPQVRALQSQVRALKSRVTRLEKTVSGIQSCERTVQGFSRYPGYVWTDGLNDYTTTAVDQPDPGEPTQVYVSVVDPRCVTGASALYSLAKPIQPQTRSTRGRARVNGMAVRQSTWPESRSPAKLSQLQRKR